MTILGKLICAARKLMRVKRVHKFGKPEQPWNVQNSIRIKTCTRCGHTVQVKPRKPRKQETEK